MRPSDSGSPASAGSFGTWNESRPEGTQSVQRAIGTIRRAHLSRVVRYVVSGSAVVCILALARVAVSASTGPDPEIHRGAHVSMQTYGLSGTFSTVHDDPEIMTPVAAAASAAPAPKHRSRRASRR
jgi:hypothetical protein